MAMSKPRHRSNPGGSRLRTRGPSSQFIESAILLAGAITRNGKDMGAQKILAIADAARSYSASIATPPQLKEYVALGAESLEGLADYVAQTDFQQMVDDAGEFSRRHPWAVIGAGLAGGLVAAQVLRSSIAMPASRRRAPRRGVRARKLTPARRQALGRKPNGRAHPNA